MKILGFYLDMPLPVFIALSAISFMIFAFGAYKRLWPCFGDLRANKPAIEKNPFKLIQKFLQKETRFRRLLFRNRLEGICHSFVFWGFWGLLLLGILVDLTVSDNPLFRGIALYGRNIVEMAFIAGILIAVSKRIICMRNASPSNRQVNFILGLLLVTSLSALAVEGLQVLAAGESFLIPSPLGRSISSLFAGLNQNILEFYHQVSSWLFTVLLLATIAYIPHSQLFHIFTGPLAIWHRSEARSGTLPVPGPQWGRDVAGLSKVSDLTSKEVFDVWGCAQCGRCEEVCPAFNVGRPLSPRNLLLELRKAFLKKQEGRADINLDPDMVYSCITCGACMEECPMMIEHIPMVVDLRRAVVERGKIPSTLTGVLESISLWGNPWKKPPTQRWDWAGGLNLPQADAPGKVDVIYWAGCTACYEPTAQGTAKAVLDLLRKAQINFGILGSRETCCGDVARRTGEEGLFKHLAQNNSELFGELGAGIILTACPHCYHIFKSEYPKEGKKWEVVHHTVFLAKLFRNGILKPARRLNSVITYHDPCYLGRYENEYENSRDALARLPAVELREMDGNRDKSYCCGGGGGQVWVDVRGRERINNVRLSHASRTGAEGIITACPYCYIMLNSSTSAGETSPRLSVQDFAQFINERV